MSRTILIVEDSQVDRTRLEKLLSSNGYLVAFAENAEQVIASVKRAKPDATPMEVNMPGQDGIAASRAPQGDAETRDIPVVLVTAMDQRANKAWGPTPGARGYVTRPFTNDQVPSQVRAR